MEARLKIFLQYLILISIVLVGSHLLNAQKFSWQSDEGWYQRYVSGFSHEGFSYFGKSLEDYWQHQKSQRYPPPTRLGYIVPVGVLYHFYPSMALLGAFSFLCYLLSLWVNLRFSRKFFDDTTAYAFSALLSASPLLMAMSRRALIEALVFLLWSSILWLCTDLAINKKNRFVGICVLFVWALMVKESSIVLLPFILICCWLGRKDDHVPWKQMAIACFCVILGLWFIPGLCVGFEIWTRSIASLFLLQKGVFVINPYVSQYCQGPWFRYIIDAMLLSPIVTLMAIGFAGHLFLQKQKAVLPLLWFVFFVTVFCPLVFLQKNIRYVMPLEMVYYLFAVLGLSGWIQNLSGQKDQHRAWALGVALIVLYNWFFFYKVFIGIGLLDPISSHLLRIEHFIP